MTIQELGIPGLRLIKPAVFRDARGFFVETWSERRYREAGIDAAFVQDNHSRSARGTLRGMHFQRTPGQAKLVRVATGRIFDVAVDIRPDSATFGRWEGVTLDAEEHWQLFLPVGFAHGFCVLTDQADVIYRVTSAYDPATEAGFCWDDPDVGIRWPVETPILSARDQSAPRLADVVRRPR